MFTGELAESRQTEVTIRDVDESAMETLIDFCYSAYIVVEEANVQTLLPAACLLQVNIRFTLLWPLVTKVSSSSTKSKRSAVSS